MTAYTFSGCIDYGIQTLELTHNVVFRSGSYTHRRTVMAHVEYPQALIDEARRMGVQLGSGEDYDPSDALETLGEEMQVSASMHGDVAGLRFAGEELVEIGDESSDFGGFSFKKLARGIGKGLKKVANSPVAWVANPGMVIGAHTLKKGITGKGLVKGSAGRLIDVGTAVVMSKANVTSVIGKSPMSALGKSIGSASKSMLPKTAIAAAKKTVTPRGVLSFGVTANANVKAAMSAADRLLGDPKVNNAALVVRNTQALAALGDPAAKRGLQVLNAVGTIRVAKKAPPGKAVVPKSTVKTPVVQTTSPARVTQLARATAAKKAADAANKTWVEKLLGWFGLEKAKS